LAASRVAARARGCGRPDGVAAPAKGAAGAAAAERAGAERRAACIVCLSVLFFAVECCGAAAGRPGIQTAAGDGSAEQCDAGLLHFAAARRRGGAAG
jgi:hypothetical protein